MISLEIGVSQPLAGFTKSLLISLSQGAAAPALSDSLGSLPRSRHSSALLHTTTFVFTSHGAREYLEHVNLLLLATGLPSWQEIPLETRSRGISVSRAWLPAIAFTRKVPAIL
jgi:hypothetical protein